MIAPSKDRIGSHFMPNAPIEKNDKRRTVRIDGGVAKNRVRKLRYQEKSKRLSANRIDESTILLKR